MIKKGRGLDSIGLEAGGFLRIRWRLFLNMFSRLTITWSQLRVRVLCRSTFCMQKEVWAHLKICIRFPRVYKLRNVNKTMPVTVVERSRACTAFVRSEAGIADSNPTQGMDV
jgi:hypothetical protein